MKKAGIIILFYISSIGLSIAQPNSKPILSEPIKVSAGFGTSPPSDALVLFDGKDLSQWHLPEDSNWNIENGILIITKTNESKKQSTYLISKKEFGDIQLHVEWKTPKVFDGYGQRRGNSGIMIQGYYEVQVLDSYENTTDPDRQCASIYNQYAPLVNVCRKPGEWQVYDIIFKAPRFKEGGNLESPAYITVLHNGVLVQNHVPILGYIKDNKYIPHPLKQPLKLQDHGNAVSFRNIWIREL